MIRHENTADANTAATGVALTSIILRVSDLAVWSASDKMVDYHCVSQGRPARVVQAHYLRRGTLKFLQ